MRNLSKWCLLFMAIDCLLFAQTHPIPEGEIGPEHLVQPENRYGDHLSVFAHLFSKIKISSFLEFGLGESTQFFLDACDFVTSVELITPSGTDAWYQRCLEMYRDYPNWTPILHVGSQKMGLADRRAAVEHLDPALLDAAYLIEIKDLCENLFANSLYEVAFVDPAFHCRGDLINELFGRVKIIVAHDTGYGDEAYGWKKVCTPFDYVCIQAKGGCGTTFWVHKSRRDVIDALLPNYLPQPKKNLRIFFPDMHMDVTKSMALLCQHLGHTLILPGMSFHPTAPNKGAKICYGWSSGAVPKERDLRIKYLRDNVEVIENDQITIDPPDLIFVTCDAVEQDVVSIYSMVKQKKGDVKLAYYSGNDHTVYNPKWVKNIITTDATTSKQFDLNQVCFAFWIPWIDWDSLPFSGISDIPIFYSYLSCHYNSPDFREGKHLYGRCISQWGADALCLFPLLDRVSQETMFQLMDGSMGTIHIKNLEGTGYTIIQSLARGRPVFLNRSFSLGKKLMNWCIEDKTVIFFDDERDFKRKVEKYLSDDEYRHFLQRSAAKEVRRAINNERQALIFEQFLHDLK